MAEIISKSMLNNQRVTITVAPRNGAAPPTVITPPPTISWVVATGVDKITIDVSNDTQSCVVHSVPGQVGNASVTYTAQDGSGVTGTAMVTLQSSLTVTLNGSFGTPVLDV